VASYAASGGWAAPGEVMKCFAADQLPVLTAMAQEFAIYDNWHASMPGPTWPNRMFVHAASSGGLDHSPTNQEIVGWETLGGFQFKAGSIFDALKKNKRVLSALRGRRLPHGGGAQGNQLVRHSPLQ
jgi:phospholipase C